MSSNTSTQKKKSRKTSSNSPEMATNILNNEKVPVQYWLEINNENIIIKYIKNRKTYNFALKKTYFVGFPNKNLYVLCQKKDGDIDIEFVLNKYNNKEVFYNLQDLLSMDIFVNQRMLIDFLKSGKKICTITDGNPREIREYINYHNMIIKNNYIQKQKKKMSLSSDIDFQISQAEKKWTYKWDTGINGSLYNGDSYFRSDSFKEAALRHDFFFYEDHYKYKKDDPRKQEILTKSRVNIKHQRDCLDISFFNSPITDGTNLPTLYRGMTQPYLLDSNPTRPLEIGDTVLMRTFTSTTTEINVALMFARKYKEKGFLYKIEPQSGVPFKTIRGSIKNEFEILFPRDIVFALIRIDHEEVEINDKGEREVYPIYVLSIHLINPNQYTTDERIRKSMRESYDERYIINSTDKHLSLLVE